MSEKDRGAFSGAVIIPNGVDLERFQPSISQPEPRRLLFIGSFAHRPNVLAIEFFLSEVWPRLSDITLHVIAGQRHERFWDLRHPGVEVEGYVADVRPAYRRAAVVIAPLVASAGTNIKILEAMAMGKAIVSTAAGIHGLDFERGRDLMVEDSAPEMARALTRLLEAPEERIALEHRARLAVERIYGWDVDCARAEAAVPKSSGCLSRNAARLLRLSPRSILVPLPVRIGPCHGPMTFAACIARETPLISKDHKRAVLLDCSLPAYWQEQDRMAVERLQQTHDLLHAHRPLGSNIGEQ